MMELAIPMVTPMDIEPMAPIVPVKPARHTRKLFDKILSAFHHACDLGDLDISDQLLPLLEAMTTRRPTSEDGNRRRNIEGLVAAHERLWHLRHPDAQT